MTQNRGIMGVSERIAPMIRAYVIAATPHDLLDYTGIHFESMSHFKYVQRVDRLDRNIPVIVLAGHGKPEQVDEVRQMGFTLIERTLDQPPGV